MRQTVFLFSAKIVTEYSPFVLAFDSISRYNKFKLMKLYICICVYQQQPKNANTFYTYIETERKIHFMASGKILIVDDDKNICELLRLYI